MSEAKTVLRIEADEEGVLAVAVNGRPVLGCRGVAFHAVAGEPFVHATLTLGVDVVDLVVAADVVAAGSEEDPPQEKPRPRTFGRKEE